MYPPAPHGHTAVKTFCISLVSLLSRIIAFSRSLAIFCFSVLFLVALVALFLSSSVSLLLVEATAAPDRHQIAAGSLGPRSAPPR